MGHKPTDEGRGEPSLELPSLRLPGLRRRAAKQAAGAPAGTDQGAPEDPHPDPSLPPHPVRQQSAGAPPAARAKDGFSLPSLPGRVAAMATGLVVGAFGTGLTYLGMAGCEAVRGTSSCGGPGLFLLVAILAVMVLLGVLLLKAWQVGDPGSTSVLAVGLVTVVALLVLVDVIFSAWMFLVVPVVAAAAFALSYWVTTRFADEPR